MNKKIGSLWKKIGSKNLFASGILELINGQPVNIAIFENLKKDPNSKQPDYHIVISTKDKQPNQTNA